MKTYRLFAGAAAAGLVATAAFAQTGSVVGPPTGPGNLPQTQPQAGAPETAPSPDTSAQTPPTGAPAPSGGAFTPIVPSPASNIIAELKSSGQFTTLLSVLDTTNLTSLVSTHPNITLIAPTDTAFAALPPGQLDMLKKSPQQLQALLTYHLIGAKIVASDVQGHAAGKVMTVANKSVTIDGSSTPIKINDASVLQAGVAASNGVIYVVDKVLTPTA